MGAIASLRNSGTSRLRSMDWTHPVRRIFGQSRAVNWGVLFLVVIITLMLVRPLVMSGLSWHRTAGRIKERRAEVAELEKKHKILKERIEHYETPEFIAEKARTYGMVEPGEQSFVIREIVHPESAAEYAISRLRNATVDNGITLAQPHK